MSKAEADPAFSAIESSGQRLFFALWPSPELRSRIFRCGQLAAAETPAGLQPVENLHLTLLFLGQVSSEIQRCLEQTASVLTLTSFNLEFDRLVHRRKSRMLWLQPDIVPPPLQSLVVALRQVAVSCGLNVESRPFCAHITLQRKVVRATVTLPQPDFVWPVREFVLVASKRLSTGAQYRIVKKWPLYDGG